MKKIVDGIIVVEGKSDVAFLSSFIDAEFVITTGSEISDDTISYLKERSKNTKIIVLTDPDYPVLKMKFQDLSIINDGFNRYIKDKAITSEDLLTLLCGYINKSDYIKVSVSK